jgi:hypothetical protein
MSGIAEGKKSSKTPRPDICHIWRKNGVQLIAGSFKELTLF